jgi:glycine betaine/proline transport system permease protein
MDPISDLIAQNKIPIGQWAKTFADVIVETFGTVLRALSGGLGDALNAIVSGLLWLPPSVLALLIAGLAWHLQRSKALAVGVFLGLMFTLNQGMWKQTVSTLVLVGSAATASMLIGLPLGIWSAHKPRVYRFLQPILDFMQTMPTFVYLIPVMALFGLGCARS